MPKRKSVNNKNNISGSSRLSRRNSKKNIDEDQSEEEIFRNSEDEYEDFSDEELEDRFNSDYDSDQSGGLMVGEENERELGSDDNTFEIDPDHEREYDEDADEKYDPVTEFEDMEDPDVASEFEDEGEADVEEADIGEDEMEGEKEDFTGESKTCHMRNLDKDFIVLDDDDSNLYAKKEFEKIPDDQRITGSTMTYYEMVRIIGTRAQQFNFGAKPLVSNVESLHPAKMAYVELMAKMTPFIIRRFMPEKKYEEWKIEELEIIHEIKDEFFVPENFTKESIKFKNKSKSKK